MSSNIVISAQNLRKVYQIYSSPMQRLGAQSKQPIGG